MSSPDDPISARSNNLESGHPSSGDGQAKPELPTARTGAPTLRPGRTRVENSAGGVVLREIDGSVHVLLIKDPYRNWGLPKGHLEEGEDSRAAALREVREETGLQELELGPELGTIDWFFRAEGVLVHKYCEFFAMRSPSGAFVPELSEGITECIWLPLGEGVRKITYDNARGILAEAERRIEADEVTFFERP